MVVREHQLYICIYFDVSKERDKKKKDQKRTKNQEETKKKIEKYIIIISDN